MGEVFLISILFLPVVTLLISCQTSIEFSWSRAMNTIMLCCILFFACLGLRYFMFDFTDFRNIENPILKVWYNIEPYKVLLAVQVVSVLIWLIAKTYIVRGLTVIAVLLEIILRGQIKDLLVLYGIVYLVLLILHIVNNIKGKLTVLRVTSSSEDVYIKPVNIVFYLLTVIFSAICILRGVI